MEFAVSRDGTTLVTLHEGTDTTACDAARAEFADALEGLETDGTLSDWAITDVEVYEPPTAPFDPYTVAVDFTVTVTVEADDTAAASEVGANRIADALDAAEAESFTFTTSATASAA